MITVGIDEVGRGCWAGPLVAAAVILPAGFEQRHALRDSKKLSKKQRDTFAKIIHYEAVAIGFGWVWPEAIDSGGITAAVKYAMEQAFLELKTDFDEVIIDGHINYLIHHPKTVAVIKADDSTPAVSAASIVAKVARDQYMYEMSLQYPKYGFENHVGYGTASHIAALQEYGVTKIHRRSFKPVAALL
jgi:ribonuclease HII